MSALVAAISRAVQNVLGTVDGLTGTWQTQASDDAVTPYCVWRHLSPSSEVDSDGEVASCLIEVIIYGKSNEDALLLSLQRDARNALESHLASYLQGATLIGLTLKPPRVILLNGYCQTSAEHLIIVE